MLPKLKAYKKTIYLDNAATTPLDPRVKKAMEPFLGDFYGNPSSLYKKGREASNAVAVARQTIAEILKCRPEEILFTAGGTESINIAIQGLAKQQKTGHIITTKIEHHAVLNTVEALEKEGFRVSYLNVDSEGFINTDELKSLIADDTFLVSVMYANNEIGTIEPISEIGRILFHLNKERLAKNLPKIYFHTDACQATGSLPIEVSKLGIDLLSANASKIYGPKQVGFLYSKTGTKLKPIIYGGGQEKNLRSGTENVAGIVGLAEALRLAHKEQVKDNKQITKLRDYLYKQIVKKIPKVVLNGPAVVNRTPPLTPPYKGGEVRGSVSSPLEGEARRGILSKNLNQNTRLPNNLNISFLDIEGEAVLLYLDSYNIAVSTGSACTSQSLDPSHVILAIGKPYEYAHGSIRMTLGKTTTKDEIDYLMKVLPGIVEELRRISPVNLDPENPVAVSMEKAFVGENMKKFKK